MPPTSRLPASPSERRQPPSRGRRAHSSNSSQIPRAIQAARRGRVGRAGRREQRAAHGAPRASCATAWRHRRSRPDHDARRFRDAGPAPPTSTVAAAPTCAIRAARRWWRVVARVVGIDPARVASRSRVLRWLRNVRARARHGLGSSRVHVPSSADCYARSPVSYSCSHRSFV